MNAVVRLLVLLYSALWVAACGGLAALAWNQDRQLDLRVQEFRLVAYVDSTTTEKWALTGVLAVLALGGIGAMILAVRRGARGSRGTVRWRQADGSMLEMPATTIEAMLRDALRQLPGVRETRPIVRAAKGTVSTELRLTIDGTTTVSDVSHAASDITFRVLREQVGALDVKRPVVRVDYVPGVAPVARPTAHTPPTTAAASTTPPIPPPPTADAPGTTATEPLPTNPKEGEGDGERSS